VKLTGEEARRRFGAARVARLATVSDSGQPHLVPITFALEDERLFCAVDAKPKSTPQLRRLVNIRANPLVSALADHYEEDWRLLWCARADGRGEVLTDPGAMAGPIALLAERYPQYAQQPPDGPVISILVARWSGWAASGGPPS
jgi:PPOX class probable F420-dependent enzyme